MKLSYSKTVTAAFHFSKREAILSEKFTTQWTFTILSDPYISRGKTGQIAHVLLSPCEMAQTKSSHVALSPLSLIYLTV